MENADGQSISGVSVEFDETLGVFTFTSGTTGDDSFVQVDGSPKFGLDDLSSSVGSTGTYRRPVAETTSQNQTVYVQLDQTEGVAQDDRTYLEYDLISRIGDQRALFRHHRTDEHSRQILFIHARRSSMAFSAAEVTTTLS